MSVASAAMAMASAGLSVIPIVPEGKKPSVGSWSPFQKEIISDKQIAELFKRNSQLGIVCGAVSGGLEVIDFDTAGGTGTPKWYEAWINSIKDANHALYEKLTVAKTPSGGRHVFYQCEAAEGNQKLACTEKGIVMIETRGNGGYVLASPSKNYEWVLGDWVTIAKVTPDERDLMLSVARALGYHAKDVVKHENTVRYSHEGRPGDRFNEETDIRDLLLDAGWLPTGRRKDVYEYWCRPGKDPKNSLSGAVITGCKPELFYCYTSSAAPLVPSRTYTPFSLFTELLHGGNASKAAGDAAKRLGMKPRPGVEPVKSAPKGSTPEEIESLFESKPIEDFEDVTPEFGILGKYIRAGQLNLIDAPGGSGKTTLLLAVAAAGSQGRDLISGEEIEPFKTLLLTTEDDPGELKSVYFDQGGRRGFLEVIEKPIDMRGENLDAFKKKIERAKFKMCVFDPILTYMPGGANVNDPAAVNHFLAGIRRAAMDTNAAIVAVRHFRKGAKFSEVMEMGAGSMQFRDTCRSQLVILDHPDADEQKHLQGVKVVMHAKGSMLVPKQPPFGYRLGLNTGIFRPTHEYMIGVEAAIKPAKGGR